MAKRKKLPNAGPKSDTVEPVEFKKLKASVLTLPEGQISFDQIVNLLGPRSFGFALLMFSVPMILPMPPGIPMAAGFVILIFGSQLLLGHPHLWLPDWVMRKTIARDRLITAYGIVEKYLGWMFHMARPRLPQLTGFTARRLSGLIFLLLGLLMILPIPIIGNILPAFACTVLALGLTDRDGLIFVTGIGVSVLAISATILMGIGAISFLNRIF